MRYLTTEQITHLTKVIGIFSIPLIYFMTYLWAFFKYYRDVSNKLIELIIVISQCLLLIAIFMCSHRFELTLILFGFIGISLIVSSMNYVYQTSHTKGEFIFSSVGLVVIMLITIINIYY